MKKLNNKGFTLLELLVSIFIITTVIFIGYKIINKSTTSVKEQGNINSGQLTMNDINKYLTNDLEQAKSIKLLLDKDGNKNAYDYELVAETKNEKIQKINDKEDILEKGVVEVIKPKLDDKTISKFNYQYIIIGNRESNYDSKYTVEIDKENRNIKYTISIIDKNGVKIDFVKDGTIKANTLPFIITGNNPYKVTMGYESKKDNFNKYEFEVVSRLDNITGGGTAEPEEPEKPPIEPPKDEIPHPDDIDKEKSLAIGFWTADKSKFEEQNGLYKDSLYTWIDDNGKFGHQDLRNQEEFYIRGDNDNGNSGHSNAYIGYNPDYQNNQAEVHNTSSKASDIDKIKIYVSPHTILKNIKINLNHATFYGVKEVGKTENLNLNNGKYTLQGNENGTWYEVLFTKHNSNKANFIIDGKLAIDKEKVSSGYGMIVYGEKYSTSQSNGDIVYEWQNSENGYEVEAYATVGNDKNKRNEKQYNETRNMSIQIDKGSSPTMIRARGIDREIATSHNEFKNIKAVQLKVEGKLKLSDIKFNNNHIGTLNHKNPSIILNLNTNQMSNNLEANFNFGNMKNKKDSGKLIVNFIY
ncbi:prepilin-type N-terminal cleavage/methylation domain-containing protein [[Clostridium] dakarense]|uniref:prepilin-type N-terminal cleavage/methylation domain-containing protein n=1 Tax=Faecalimicrobium dakarense TaxID=1301100 RepID=UPI0004B11DC3|nr:prepilin-type N-terminal cleavage/methylation domain-containing protein [[Clostridium] dakarense]